MTLNTQLENLMTGHRDVDTRIQAAYELGATVAADKLETVKLNASIDAVRRCLNNLMCSQGMDLQKAMIALRLPKAERKTYEKIFSARRK